MLGTEGAEGQDDTCEVADGAYPKGTSDFLRMTSRLARMSVMSVKNSPVFSLMYLRSVGANR